MASSILLWTWFSLTAHAFGTDWIIPPLKKQQRAPWSCRGCWGTTWGLVECLPICGDLYSRKHFLMAHTDKATGGCRSYKKHQWHFYQYLFIQWPSEYQIHSNMHGNNSSEPGDCAAVFFLRDHSCSALNPPSQTCLCFLLLCGRHQQSLWGPEKENFRGPNTSSASTHYLRLFSKLH